MIMVWEVVVRNWIEYVFGSPVYASIAIMIVTLALIANYRLGIEAALVVFFMATMFTTYLVLPKIIFVLLLIALGLLVAYAISRWKT